MLAAVQRALDSYRHRAWTEVVKRIIALDFSWESSARRYELLYLKALDLPKRDHNG